MKTLITIFLSAILTACASIPIPPEVESGQMKEFTQISNVDYKDAYRIIAKQFRACYRVIGLFGNGYDVQADLDTEKKVGSIELYHVGLTGASKFEDSIFSSLVTITPTANKESKIITTGTTPKYSYIRSQAIKGWLRGDGDTCAPVAD